MGCLKLTYCEEETCFLEERSEKSGVFKLRVWVNPERDFLGVDVEEASQGDPQFNSSGPSKSSDDWVTSLSLALDAGSVITRTQFALERVAGKIPIARTSALTKTLGLIGKAAGIVDAYQHGSDAYDQFNNGDVTGGLLSAGKTALDITFILYKGSNPFVLGASIAWGLYNTGEDLYSIYNVK